VDSGACADCGGLEKIVLLYVVIGADQVETVVDSVFGANPENVFDPDDAISVGGDPNRKKFLVVEDVAGDAVAANRLEAI
jgi:hypothetical protein